LITSQAGAWSGRASRINGGVYFQVSFIGFAESVDQQVTDPGTEEIEVESLDHIGDWVAATRVLD
jgi:hypothetical protein